MIKERKTNILVFSWLLLTAACLFSQVSLIPGITQSIQAEDVVFSQGVLETINAGFTGSGYVNLDNLVGSYIEWTVRISIAADADCSLVFANGTTVSRGMEVLVNGNVSLANHSFPATGSWTSWSAAVLVLGLQAGVNTIRLTSTGSEGGPNLDRLDITLRGQAGPVVSLGDVNGSGKIDIVDALMTAQFYVGLNPQGFIQGNADVNIDGRINIVDALIIAQIYVGLVSPPATPTPLRTPTPTPRPTATPASTLPAGNNLYASPSGSSGNGGTSFSDALDLKTALRRVSAGQTLFLQAGTYKIPYSSGNKNSISLTNNGSSSKRIRVEGYNGQAKLDFQCPAGDWVQDSFAFDLQGDYWYFKNIDITRSPYHAVYVVGAYNTFEDCNFYDNRTTGFEINKGGSYTTVINCDSYNNYDPKRNGGMADGFASKQEQGKGNKFIGCNAWGNSDDGYDTFDSSLTVTFENCTANENGTHDGNGNGFKLGGNGVTAIQYLTNCVANNNRKYGFHANGNPGPIYLTNCTAKGNGEGNFNGNFVIK